MDNNAEKRPTRKRVTKKVLRQRQFGALAVISFLVLLFIILIFKGCSGGGEGGKGSKEPATTTTTEVVTTTVPVTTVATTTANPLALQVELSKREMFLQNVGDMDISYINSYPDGSAEINEVWSSLDESIAMVDEWGHVTAVGPGETFIILSFNNNPGIEIEIKVHVADGSGALGVVPDDSAEPSGDDTSTPETVFTTPAAPVDDEDNLA